MQSDSGLLGWLKVPSVYNMFSAAVGGNVLRRSLIQNHVRANPGDKVIDIGCGSAEVLRYLPDVDYIGVDINPEVHCIRQANLRQQGNVPGRRHAIIPRRSAIWRREYSDGVRPSTPPGRSRGNALSPIRVPRLMYKRAIHMS